MRAAEGKKGQRGGEREAERSWGGGSRAALVPACVCVCVCLRWAC